MKMAVFFCCFSFIRCCNIDPLDFSCNHKLNAIHSDASHRADAQCNFLLFDGHFHLSVHHICHSGGSISKRFISIIFWSQQDCQSNNFLPFNHDDYAPIREVNVTNRKPQKQQTTCIFTRANKHSHTADTNSNWWFQSNWLAYVVWLYVCASALSQCI